MESDNDTKHAEDGGGIGIGEGGGGGGGGDEDYDGRRSEARLRRRRRSKSEERRSSMLRQALLSAMGEAGNQIVEEVEEEEREENEQRARVRGMIDEGVSDLTLDDDHTVSRTVRRPMSLAGIGSAAPSIAPSGFISETGSVFSDYQTSKSTIHKLRKMTRTTLRLITGNPVGSTAFVSFRSLAVASIAGQCMTYRHPLKMVVSPAPHQDDIIWANICQPMRQVR